MSKVEDGVISAQHKHNGQLRDCEWTNMDTMGSDDKEKKGNNSTTPHFFVRFSQESSFSGLKYIGEHGSSFLRRFMWFMIVLLALAGLMFQIVKCTMKFIDGPISTKLSYVEKTEMDFPSVTICNTNMFSQDRLVPKYGGYTQFYDGLNELRNIFPPIGLGNTPTVPLPDEYPPGGNVSLYDFIWDNAPTIEDTIYGCQFNTEPCSLENFTTVVTNYGVCMTFTPSFKVTSPGQAQGLGLFLNVREDGVTAAPRQNLGFKLLPHRQDEVPYNMQDFGVEVDVGKHTSLSVETREFERLPTPDGCMKEVSGTLKYLSGGYTKSKCFLECETDHIVSVCNCRSFYMPGNATFCNPHQLVECFYPAQRSFGANKYDLCSCRDVCVETKYGVSISQTTFPNINVAYVLRIADQDFENEKWAFIDSMGGRTTKLFETLSQEVYIFTTNWLYSLTNGNQTSFEVFPNWYTTPNPNTFYELPWLIQTEVHTKLLLNIYDEINPITPTLNISYGSPFYFQAKQEFADIFLDLYKSKFVAGLVQDYEVLGETNITFEEFADGIYEDFSIEEGYFGMEELTYQLWYTALLDLGTTLYSETDLYELTTNWLRKNIAFIEIYFGDMEVESIKEQEDYEIFQYICDCGGALGLFFGASLLSFIETVDFTYRDFYGAKNK